MSETTKSKGGRPAVNATPVTVRVPPDLLRALDDARATDGGSPTRPEMVRRTMTEWLREKGFLK